MLGHEQGTFLALDLGGSNLRVGIVKLQERTTQVLNCQAWLIPDEIRNSSCGEDFFAWISNCVADALEQLDMNAHGFQQGTWKLGLSWSFPFEQTSVAHAKMHAMGKGFRLQSLIGRDINELLTTAFALNRRLPKIQVCAILNDAVATLLSCAYVHPNTRMGMICGTGTNATCMVPARYFSSSDKLPSSVFEQKGFGGSVLVNAEWSMFGAKSIPMTDVDHAIDASEEIPGYQPFEYLIGGRYLGEIVRQTLVDGFDNHHGFANWSDVPPSWRLRWSLETKTISQIEAYANETNLHLVLNLLDSLHPLPPGSNYTIQNARDISTVCNAVSTRAVRLLASAIIALLDMSDTTQSSSPSRSPLRHPQSVPNVQPSVSIPTQNGLHVSIPADEHRGRAAKRREAITVSYTGTVLEKYTNFKDNVQATLDELCDITLNSARRLITLKHVDEGGLLGASVLAAMSHAE